MICNTVLQSLRKLPTPTPFAPAASIFRPNFPRRTLTNMSHKKRALIFLAPGFEEVEFTTAVNVLRRGNVEVIVASTEGQQPVVGSRQIRVLPDLCLSKVNETFDAIILPGGLKGAETMAACARIGELLRDQEKQCRIIAAICAAPIALKAHGIGKGKSLTSYPAMEKILSETGDYNYKTDEVVVDEYLITSRGPATAMKFALTILKQLTDDVVSCEVAKTMLCF